MTDRKFYHIHSYVTFTTEPERPFRHRTNLYNRTALYYFLIFYPLFFTLTFQFHTIAFRFEI
jgi:hypothetical protein